MTKQQQIAFLAREAGVPQSNAKAFLEGLQEMIKSELHQNGQIRLDGIATFKKVKREGRHFRNPQDPNGGTVFKPAHFTVTAKVDKRLKPK